MVYVVLISTSLEKKSLILVVVTRYYLVASGRYSLYYIYVFLFAIGVFHMVRNSVEFRIVNTEFLAIFRTFGVQQTFIVVIKMFLQYYL